jgi:hypothetical protein
MRTGGHAGSGLDSTGGWTMNSLEVGLLADGGVLIIPVRIVFNDGWREGAMADADVEVWGIRRLGF